MRGNVPQTNLHANQHADDLSNHRARAEERRQQREGADQRQRDQPERVAGERGEAVGNPVAQAGSHDDADQRRDERHKRQNGLQHRVDGVAPGLEQYRHGGTHAHPDLCQQAIALLGNFLAGVVLARGRFLRRRRPLHQGDVVFLHA